MYVTGDDDTIAYTVQSKLEDLEADGKADLTHTISRNFDYTIGKVAWVWQVNLYGSIVYEEDAPTPAAGGNE